MESTAKLLQRQEGLIRLLPEVRWRLRHIPSIRNIGIGAKEVKGEVTDEFAFRIYVDIKLPTDTVPSTSRIPERICGIPTDVLLAWPTDILADARKMRPLKGGLQIRNEYVEGENTLLTGTLGCLAKSINTLEVMALSCEHVLLAGQASVGVAVGQPRYVLSCCCCTYNVVGKVSKALKDNRVDCGVVLLDEDVANEVETADVLNHVEGIGVLTGAGQAVCFETVRKRGRTTELTTAQVVDVLFEGSQILVQPTAPPTFADRGDSGSVLVNAANRVVGLLWATDAPTRTKGVANHIGPVMKEMEILIAGDTSAGLGIPATGCP